MYEPIPALIRHGQGFRPESIRAVGREDVMWHIEAVLDDERGGGTEADPIDRTYRFRVTGQRPDRGGERGTFTMVAVHYLRRPYWWVRPETGNPDA